MARHRAHLRQPTSKGLRPQPIRQTLLASESGRIDTAGGSGLNIALAFPNTYYVGMSSLGFQTIYRLSAERPDTVVERVFTDWPEGVTLESGRPVGDADVLAFSVSYEMDFMHILELLARAGLNPLARARAGGGPLIVAGGPAVWMNRLPIYDVCDVFVHGSAEGVWDRFLDACARWQSTVARDRARLYEELIELPGVEITAGAQWAAGVDFGVPVGEGRDGRAPVASALDPRLTPRIAPPRPNGWTDLDRVDIYSPILSSQTEFADKCLVELSRGCPHHCTFCWAGHHIKPYALRSAEAVIRIIESRKRYGDAFGLVAAAVGAHPAIDAICAWCDRADLRISFSSLRAEDVTEGMLRTLARSGQRSITLAPETAAPRLKKLLGKRIGEERMIEVMERSVSLGMRDVKLYFMIGTPTETEEEALEIAGYLERFREAFVNASRPRGVIGSISVNCGVYVPHPGTPLDQVGPPPEPTDVRRRLKRLSARVGRLANVRLTPGSVDNARAQRVLANGGRDVYSFLELAGAAQGKWRSVLSQWEKERPAAADKSTRD